MPVELSVEQIAFLADILGRQSVQVGSPDFPQTAAMAATTYKALLTALEASQEAPVGVSAEE